jgi:hypothetical protein
MKNKKERRRGKVNTPVFKRGLGACSNEQIDGTEEVPSCVLQLQEIVHELIYVHCQVRGEIKLLAEVMDPEFAPPSVRHIMTKLCANRVVI